MFKFFRKQPFFSQEILEDDRTEEQRAKDYQTEEILTAQPLVWEDWEVWRQKPENVKMLQDFKVGDQRQTGSCAGFSGALLLAINNYLEEKRFVEMSPATIYARRKNKPDRGMFMHDVGNIAIKHGVVPEVLFPTNTSSDAAMSDLSNLLPSFEKAGKIYKADSYFWLNTSSIDSVANVLNRNIPVLMAVRFGDNEWGRLKVPVIRPIPPTYGHATIFLPRAFFTYQGRKAVLLQDSHGIDAGFQGRRILTEDWFSSGRVFLAIWFTDMKNLEVFNKSISKPKLNLTRNLQVGDRGVDVAQLQRALGYLKDAEGYLFPLAQAPTGFYGGITRNAIQRFQRLYSLLMNGIVDNQTRAKLNEVFS